MFYNNSQQNLWQQVSMNTQRMLDRKEFTCSKGIFDAVPIHQNKETKSMQVFCCQCSWKRTVFEYLISQEFDKNLIQRYSEIPSRIIVLLSMLRETENDSSVVSEAIPVQQSTQQWFTKKPKAT